MLFIITIPFNKHLDLPVLVVYLGLSTAPSCTSLFTTEFVVKFMDRHTQHVLRSIQDKGCTLVGHSCDGAATEYTNEDYCSKLITLGACTAAQEHTPHCIFRRCSVVNTIDACSNVAVRQNL